MSNNSNPPKPPKEYIEFLEKKLYVKEMGIENRLKDVQETIENSIEPGRKRFQRLRNELDKKFLPGSAKRGAADGITFFLFDSAFELFFIGNNSSLFIELHGLLERFCISKACEFIAIDDLANSILQDTFAKKTLSDIAEYFKIISLWSEDEIKFAKKLTHVRNGIAHKNTELVNKHLGDGKKQPFTSIDTITKDTNAIPYIITTIELIVKISDAAKPSFLEHPRFRGRLEAYSSVIGLVMNLFCDPEIMSLPNEVKFTMFNRIFSKTYLLASEPLRNAINDYREIIINFHDQIGVDDEEARGLHSKLITIASTIFEEMKKDLGVDGDSNIFIKPKALEVDFSRIKRAPKQ